MPHFLPFNVPLFCRNDIIMAGQPPALLASLPCRSIMAILPPHPCPRSNDIIVAWKPLPGTNAELTRDNPLNEGNRISMVLTGGAPGEQAGKTNGGWQFDGGLSATACSLWPAAGEAGVQFKERRGGLEAATRWLLLTDSAVNEASLSLWRLQCWVGSLQGNIPCLAALLACALGWLTVQRPPDSCKLTPAPRLAPCTAGTPSGIVNFGYWGVALKRQESYTVSLYLRTSEVSG